MINFYYNPEIHHRRSIRLERYDYSLPGYYYVTICSLDRECIFGEIKNFKIKLTEIGNIIKCFIPKIEQYFYYIKIDIFSIMPNHLHLIIIINESTGGGICKTNFNSNGRGEVTSPLPTENQNIMNIQIPPNTEYRCQPTLGQIVAYYKYQTTKIINQKYNSIGKKVWQRNYYEHIIRNEKELEMIREYIKYNPSKWAWDRNN